MNQNNYIFYDFETGGKDKFKSQPIQLAAVAIDARTLEMDADGTFETLMLPEFDEERCVALEIEPLQDEALNINKKTREELAKAPSAKVAWENFATFVDRYSVGKRGIWDKPICAGYNNRNFDDFFTARLCREYGPFDKEWQTQKMFHPIHNIDMMQVMYQWTEDLKGWKSLSMDKVREHFGMTEDSKHLKKFKKEGQQLYAHDALRDVLDGGELLCRFLKLTRKFSHTTKFKDSCK